MPQTTKPRETNATRQRAATNQKKIAEKAAPPPSIGKKSPKKPNEATKSPRPLPQPSQGAKAGGRGRPLSSTLSFRPTSTKTSTFQVDASKLQKRGSSNEQFDSKKVGSIKSKAAMRNKAESKSISEERERIEEPMDTDEEDYSSPAAFGHGTKRFSQTTARTPQTKRILILGKTGNGKSSLGNLILGKNAFTVGKSMSSCTRTVATQEGIVDAGPTQVRVEVTDTPDVTDKSKRAQLTKLAKNETFDLVLFTVRVDVRFSPEEKQVYTDMKDVFREALTRNLVVAFTFDDMLAGDVRKFTDIPSLQEVLSDAGGRYMVVNNKAKGKVKKETVVELLQYLDADSYAKRGSAALSRRPPTAEAMETADDAYHDIDNDRGLNLNSTIKTSRQPRATERMVGQPDDRREGPPCVLVIGKTGNGKSSVCNMLLGEKRFKEGRGMSSTTTSTDSEQSNKAARFLFTVVDTPDISSSDFGGNPREEMERWRQLKPDAILLAVRCDVRYTPEEYQIYRQIEEGLGQAYVKSRLIVAFTFGDLQDHSLEDDLDGAGKHLQTVACQQAGNRHVLFNKKASAKEKEKCLQNLTSILTKMRKP